MKSKANYYLSYTPKIAKMKILIIEKYFVENTMM